MVADYRADVGLICDDVDKIQRRIPKLEATLERRLAKATSSIQQRNALMDDTQVRIRNIQFLLSKLRSLTPPALSLGGLLL
jgi:hypothetical protein